MMKDRKDTAAPGRASAAHRAKRKNETAQTDRSRPEEAAKQHNKSNAPKLPPNENIDKYADEVYGDTEIPQRKKGS